MGYLHRSLDVHVRRSGIGAGFTMSFGSRDKVSITSAAVLAKG